MNIYVMFTDGKDCENMVILETEEEAINASRQYPQWHVDVYTSNYEKTLYIYKHGSRQYNPTMIIQVEDDDDDNEDSDDSEDN